MSDAFLNPGSASAAASAAANDLPGACFLSDFDRLYAPLVASWVLSPRELTWLAPGTVPPLTPAKVVGWGKPGGRRYLFWSEALVDPIGYAELNPMPRRPDQFWIGHFVVSPAVRGRGQGRRFHRALLSLAFNQLGAADVLLVVVPENRIALRCYQGNGMIITGRERRRFGNLPTEHVFLRMEIKRHRFERLVRAGGVHDRSGG